MQILPSRRRRGTGASPWRDFDLLEDQMQRMFRGFPLWERTTEAFTWMPPVDLVDEDGGLMLTAELPGVEPNEVDIEVEGNILRIRGEKRLEQEQTEERVRMSERHYGTFERTFTLPSTADPEEIEAHFHQGVLRLRIGKKEEARGRKIEVKST